jgi:DNA mismatch endonuclease (patch repair protein)
MARIRVRDTTPERIVRSLLHRQGLRFRVNVAILPGRPDVVLRRHETVVFVHGCFWHSHSGCRLAAKPGTNRRFWRAKMVENKQRDRKVEVQLRRLGWRVLVIWECETRDEQRRSKLRRRIKRLFQTT